MLKVKKDGRNSVLEKATNDARVRRHAAQAIEVAQVVHSALIQRW